MTYLNLDYFKCTGRLRKPEDWLQSQEIRSVFQKLGHDLQMISERPRIAICGSSWSGYMAWLLLQKYGIGEVECIFESQMPLRELAHIKHFHPESVSDSVVVDCVLMATSPRHYPQIESLIKKKVQCRQIVGMYQPVQKVQLAEPDVWLDVFVRIANTEGRETLPLARENLAVILIDVWGELEQECKLCEPMKRLLSIARDNNLVVIHAPTHYPGHQGSFINKHLFPPPLKQSLWPPGEFFGKTGRFEHLNVYHRQVESGIHPVPTSVHHCAKPVKRKNEYVESTLEGVLEILENHKSLYILYAGGAIMECLLLKPAGYLNMKRHGYQPVLVRDAASAASQSFDGQLVDTMAPGTILFETICGFSTCLDDLENAFK